MPLLPLPLTRPLPLALKYHASLTLVVTLASSALHAIIPSSLPPIVRNVTEGVGGALACALWLWGSNRYRLQPFLSSGHGNLVVGNGAMAVVKGVAWLAAAGGTVGLVVYLCQSVWRSKKCKLS